MYHWDRNTAGRLERINAPQEQGCEVSINSGPMEPPLEEQQQSQQSLPSASTPNLPWNGK